MTKGKVENVALDLQPNEFAILPSEVKPVIRPWHPHRDSPLLLNGREDLNVLGLPVGRTRKVDPSPAFRKVPLSQGGVRWRGPGHPSNASSYRRQLEDLGKSVPS